MSSSRMSWPQVPGLHHFAPVLMALVALALAWGVAAEGWAALGVWGVFLSIEACILTACSGGSVVLARRVAHFGASPGPALSALVLVSLALGLALAVTLGLAFFGWGVPYEGLWLLALGLPWLVLAPNVSGFWLGQGRRGVVAFIELSGPLLSLAGWGLAVLLGAPATLVTILLMWVLGRSVASWLSLVAALHATGWAPPDVRWLRAQVLPMCWTGLVQLVSAASQRVDLWSVRHHLGDHVTGTYFLALALAAVPALLAVACSQAMLSNWASRSVSTRGSDCRRAIVALCSALVWIVLWGALAQGVVMWVGPGQTVETARMLSSLLLVLIPAIWAQASLGLLVSHWDQQPARSWRLRSCWVIGFAGVVNVGLCALWLPHIGLVAAAWANLVTNMGALLLVCWTFKRQAKWSWQDIYWAGASLCRMVGRLSWGRVRRVLGRGPFNRPSEEQMGLSRPQAVERVES